tara:strand:+ start:300 stop:665 length:366 start_codon:yes stop_codon:yes gene_type:complete
MNNIVEGGCFCGSVRYTFKFGEYPSANCYCSICRRTSGAPFVSWLAIPLTSFEYKIGTPKKLISSSQGTRYFCEDCGTPLTCLLDEYPKYIYVTICSLVKPQEFKPNGDMHIEDMLDWVKT